VKKYYLQIYRHTLSLNDDDTWVDVRTLEIHPDVAYKLAELGIIEISSGHIPAAQVQRIRKLMRLRRGLGVNVPGAAIILDLLDKIELLQEEIERLKRR